MSVQGILYIIAVILLVLGRAADRFRGVSLALLGAACALLAYSWHAITA